MIIGSEQEQGTTVMDQVGPYIIGHVSNSDQSHPIFHFPTIFGIEEGHRLYPFCLLYTSPSPRDS